MSYREKLVLPTVKAVLDRVEAMGPRLSLNEKYVLSTAIKRANRIEAENLARNQAAWKWSGK